MNNDTLLAKLLDGSLTQAERQHLDAMIAASPEFADEVRELQMVEELLVSSPVQDLPNASPFLRTLENKVALTMGSAGAAGVAGALATSSTNVISANTVSASTKVLLSMAASLLIVASAALYFGTDSADEPETATIEQTAPGEREDVQAEMAPNSAQVPDVQAPAATNESTESVNSAPPPELPLVASRTADEMPAQPADEELSELQQDIQQRDPFEELSSEAEAQREGRGIADNSSDDDSTKRMEQSLQAELHISREQNDDAKRAVNAKRLGSFYRQHKVKQLQDQSRALLEEALLTARRAGLQETEAETLGELAMLDSAQRDYASARQRLKQCIEILQAVQSPQLERWRETLAKLPR